MALYSSDLLQLTNIWTYLLSSSTGELLLRYLGGVATGGVAAGGSCYFLFYSSCIPDIGPGRCYGPKKFYRLILGLLHLF